MIIFVVGPSGAGKTELIRLARLEIQSELLDLDIEENKSKEQEWSDGWGGRRWTRDRRRIEAAERGSAGVTIVDVGAG